jgi:hypothetical protein
VTQRHRGAAYPFPLAYALLDVFNGQGGGLIRWDKQRVAKGIPSIFG